MTVVTKTLNVDDRGFVGMIQTKIYIDERRLH